MDGPRPLSPVTPTYALQLEHISKSFGPIHANRDITLRVAPGTIHGVVGENGAGKTTLMRIAYGFYQADEGEILVDGAKVELASPRAALAAGIGMVHQHSLLVESMSVTENVLLADDRPLLALGSARDRIRALGMETGLQVDPGARIRQLSVADRQRVEILKALYYGARILILDEPTAVLTPQEARALFGHLRAFAAEGRTIVIITHKLPEVMDVTSQVSVLRAGELVYESPTSATDQEALARAMVGRSVALRLLKVGTGALTTHGTGGAPVLQVRSLVADDDVGVQRVNGVDLEVRAGEIVGIAGVEGNGQTQLVEAITGLRRPREGRVMLEGEDVTATSPRERRERGMRHVPEDRLDRGVNPVGTVSENLVAGRHYRAPLAGRWRMHGRRVDAHAKELIQRFSIAAQGPGTRLSTLSGGNMQKVVIARELEDGARLIVVAQPTQGVDVGASEFIRAQLVRMRDEGAAILLVTSELTEVVDLADRVYVLSGGDVVGEVVGDEIDEERLGMLMLAGREAPAEIVQEPVGG